MDRPESPPTPVTVRHTVLSYPDLHIPLPAESRPFLTALLTKYRNVAKILPVVIEFSPLQTDDFLKAMNDYWYFCKDKLKAANGDTDEEGEWRACLGEAFMARQILRILHLNQEVNLRTLGYVERIERRLREEGYLSEDEKGYFGDWE